RESVRIERGVRRHSENLARRGLDGDHGTLVIAESLSRCPLHGIIDGEFDGGALRRLSGENRVELCQELVARRATQIVIEFALDARVALVEREIPGDVGVQFGLEVRAQVFELAVDWHRFCDDPTLYENRPPLRG